MAFEQKDKVSLNKNNSGNSCSLVQALSHKTQKNIILGHLNVNFLRNKIEAVEQLIRNNTDISLFSETTSDDIFPSQQLKISDYKMFTRDRNKHGGGITFYINENIPCRLNWDKSETPGQRETFHASLNFMLHQYLLVSNQKIFGFVSVFCTYPISLCL